MYNNEPSVNLEENNGNQENRDSDNQNYPVHNREGKLFSVVVPAVFLLFLLTGFTYNSFLKTHTGTYDDGFTEVEGNELASKLSLISSEELMSPVKDTVYTDKDCWLELRIHEQYVYQHWRDGKVEKFPISSGNKYISKGIESRPGLFAIFYRNPHHKSTQFDDASLYHFQTFNQGIGFHSLAGTGYYSLLGVRPASHGCIRMKHEHARKLFEDCSMGTLVLAHNGYSSRVVAFAPKGFVNENYTKDEQKVMLAQNLKNVLEGNYYAAERKYFVVDPTVIPMSGVYISYDKQIPKKQKLPVNLFTIETKKDRISASGNKEILDNEAAKEIYSSLDYKDAADLENKPVSTEVIAEDDAAVIKKYFHNPIGILPYFPPTKRAPKVTYTVTSTSTSDDSGSE